MILTLLAVFSDQKVGVLKHGNQYHLIEPQVLLVACGAREKFLAFKGNSLPGVYGAGAFQTLVNRDLVRPANRLFIVGGGNVGLIAAYHALQAGIEVAGLVEALPDCGGYKVHQDKLLRLGVPIYTGHTILSANGSDQVKSVTIAAVDEHFKPITGSEKSFSCDSVLIAVGLDPVDEFFHKAVQYGLPAFVAGDAEEIAEASAAIYSGKIRGVEIARRLGCEDQPVPKEWAATGAILRSKPGQTALENLPETERGIFPLLHCVQEIPCDPCTTLCPEGLIQIAGDDFRKTPIYIGDEASCKACNRCVAGCPGLAISLVNYRKDFANPIVSLPFEFSRDKIHTGDLVVVRDISGRNLGKVPVVSVQSISICDHTLVVRVQAPAEIAKKIAGVRIQPETISAALPEPVEHLADDAILCRCEQVPVHEVRTLIRQGMRDINEIKTITRAGMGACGSKTCTNLLLRLFREEGVPLDEVTDNTRRPLFVEVPLGVFAGLEAENE